MNDLVKPGFQNEDLRLAFFSSLKEKSRARLLFREDKTFQNIPWDDSPPLSIVMPLRAIALLKKRGLSFQIKEPVTEDSITPEQRRAWNERKTIRCKCLCGATFFLEEVCIVHEKGNFYVKT